MDICGLQKVKMGRLPLQWLGEGAGTSQDLSKHGSDSETD